MPTQRLNINEQVTSSTTGTATFQFPAPPTDLVWHGTLSCLAAPAGVIFSATIAGTPWCSWLGPSIGGPVQALPGEQLIVTATGLVANTVYTLQWIGRSDPLSSTAPSYPDASTSGAGGLVQPSGTSFAVNIQGGASQATTTNGSATTAALLGAPPTGEAWILHNATFTLGSGATAAQIVGATSGFVYTQCLGTATPFTPLIGQIAAEALNLVTTGGGGSVWLSYDLGNQLASIIPPALFPLRAASGTFGVPNNIASPLTFSLPNSYVTVLNDCIVIAYSLSNVNGFSAISGCGATWLNLANGVSNQNAGFLVGYGCTAGGSTVTFTVSNTTSVLALAIGVWGGVLATSSPVVLNPFSASASTVTSITSPGLSFTNQQLVLASSSCQQVTIKPLTWLNGSPNTNIANLLEDNAGTREFVSLDQMNSSFSSPTGTTISTSDGSSQKMRIALLSLAHQ